jgi:hypothetical protein
VAVTVAQIVAEFPEFANTDSGLIQAKIEDASELLDATAFDDDFDEAVKYMTCHLIAVSPSGEFARLDPSKETDGASSTYERHYRRIALKISGPMAV